VHHAPKLNLSIILKLDISSPRFPREIRKNELIALFSICINSKQLLAILKFSVPLLKILLFFKEKMIFFHLGGGK